MLSSKESKEPGNLCAYKAQSMKAYDRVYSNFLETAMRRIGFARRWMEWILDNDFSDNITFFSSF
jgi:hypothetical protein